MFIRTYSTGNYLHFREEGRHYHFSIKFPTKVILHTTSFLVTAHGRLWGEELPGGAIVSLAIAYDEVSLSIPMYLLTRHVTVGESNMSGGAV